jgi:chaperonin GroES
LKIDCVLQFKAVKPVGDRVLVKVDKEEAKTQGGVLLPSIAQTKPTAGSIVGVGSVEFTKVRIMLHRLIG